MFKRYPHLVKFGGSEVENIEFGTVYVFPKLDGTNASLWLDGRLRAGSRNRELDTVNPGNRDNAGFAEWAVSSEAHKNFLVKSPSLILYGEWLVPHTLKGYRDDSWRKFYIFDVYDRETDKYIPYDTYKPWLDEYQLDYIPCTKIFRNPSWENLMYESKNCRYLLKDDTPVGEGIVIKNYDFVNKVNQVTWAKIINNEFKDDFYKIMGAPIQENRTPAQIICDIACTEPLIEKEYAKIAIDGAFSKRHIPRLLHTVFYSVVTEELWDCLKKVNYGLVNFKELQQLCTLKVKQVKPELFT